MSFILEEFPRVLEILEVGNLFTHRRNWHPMNIQHVLAVKDIGSVYNRRSCYLIVRKIFAFIITMYEFDIFTKILLVTDLWVDIEEQVENLLHQKMKYFIIKWLPGMLTSRYMICKHIRLVRGRRKKEKHLTLKFPIIRICRPTLCRLYRLPSLFLLSNVLSYCKIAASEAVRLKILTIGILDSNALPININFYIPGNCSNFKRLNLFLYLLKKAMIMGKESGLEYRRFKISNEPIKLKKKIPIPPIDLRSKIFKRFLLKRFIKVIDLKSYFLNEMSDFELLNHINTLSYSYIFYKFKRIKLGFVDMFRRLVLRKVSRYINLMYKVNIGKNKLVKDFRKFFLLIKMILKKVRWFKLRYRKKKEESFYYLLQK